LVIVYCYMCRTVCCACLYDEEKKKEEEEEKKKDKEEKVSPCEMWMESLVDWKRRWDDKNDENIQEISKNLDKKLEEVSSED